MFVKTVSTTMSCENYGWCQQHFRSSVCPNDHAEHLPDEELKSCRTQQQADPVECRAKQWIIKRRLKWYRNEGFGGRDSVMGRYERDAIKKITNTAWMTWWKWSTTALDFTHTWNEVNVARVDEVNWETAFTYGLPVVARMSLETESIWKKIDSFEIDTFSEDKSHYTPPFFFYIRPTMI